MIRYYLLTVLLFSSIGLFVSCSDSSRNKATGEKDNLPDFDIAVAKKGIEEANLEFVAFFNKSDSEGLASMFTIDGESMEPNELPIYGRDKIQAHYAQVMKAGTNKLTLVTVGLWGTVDLLAEEGDYTIVDKDGQELDKGKYIVLWKIEDGKWKLFRDCYNSNLSIPSNI